MDHSTKVWGTDSQFIAITSTMLEVSGLEPIPFSGSTEEERISHFAEVIGKVICNAKDEEFTSDLHDIIKSNLTNISDKHRDV